MGLRGGGPQRQASGSADSGCGDTWDGDGEIWIWVMAGKWQNSVLKCSSEICGEISQRNVRACSKRI